MTSNSALRFARLRLTVLLAIVVAACSGQPSSDQISLTVDSRIWIKPEFNDIYTKISLAQLTERVYSMRLSSSRGLDPSNPSLGVLMRCVARSFASKRGYEGWSIGIPEGKGDEMMLGAKAVEMTLVLVNRGEQPQAFERSNVGPVVYNDDRLRSRCAGVIRPEFM